MGIIFFWMHDHSKEQRRTAKLIDHTLGTILKLVTFSALPLMKPLTKNVVDIIAIIEDKR